MSVCFYSTIDCSPDAAETLKVLEAALADRIVPADRRVIASSNSRSPDDGLALLNAYVAIADPAVRQAVLDAVMTIAGPDAVARGEGRGVS